MQYKLCWIDSYNIDNWGSMKKLKETYPNIVDYMIEEDNWAECEHCYEFEAISDKQAKRKAIKYLVECGRNVDVFSVIDINNKIILTEDDF